MKYVHFTRGTYKVRVVVPPDLRAIVGKSELIENLGADKKTAERHAHRTIAGFLAVLDDARAQREANKPTLSAAAKAHYQAELEADTRERRDEERTLISLRRMTQPRRAALLRLVAIGETTEEEAEALIGYAADEVIRRGFGAGIPRADLLKALAEVQLDALAQFEARDNGSVISPMPNSRLLTMPEPEPVDIVKLAKAGAEGKTLTDIVTAFHRERDAGRTLAKKTKDEHRSAVRMLEEYLGGSVPARSITKKDMLAYKQALLETPARYVLRFPGLSLPQAIRANQKRTKPFPTLDPATINMKWLSHLSTIFKWGMNNGYLDDNPAAGVRVDEGKGYKEPSRVAFDQADLKRIFGSSLFRETAWGTKQWALVLALYTGARSSSELARIRLTDIYEEQGIPVLNLALASKNVRSKRLVPIHKDVLDLGFLDHVERLRQAGEKRLFADWEPEDALNRWFLRSYRAQVGITDRRKVFHSFRHTLKTALARHGVNRDVSDLITGHADQRVSAIYITDAAVTMIQAMADGLNRVRFDLPLGNRP